MGPANDRARQHPAANERRAQTGQAQDRHVPEADLRREQPQVDLDEAVAGVHQDQPLHTVGSAQGRHEGHETAPVVTREGEALEPQPVADGQQVIREPFLVVAAGGGVRPPESAHVRADDLKAIGQQRNHAVPGVPVLRPAVLQHDRRPVARCCDVHPQPSHVDEAVLHSRDGGQFDRHSAQGFS
jgi:hypothetical protein